MARLALALTLLAACAGDDGAAALDPAGRLMLDPLREQALHPESLVPRLALRRDAVVADVGAGPGFLTLPPAPAVPEGKVIATDVRPAYLAVAARRAARAGLRNVETRAAPPEDPALPAGAIDLALLCQVDHYLADRARYLAALI